MSSCVHQWGCFLSQWLPSSSCTWLVLHPQVLQKPTPELKHQLAALSKRVAGAVTELIQAAEAMKGRWHPLVSFLGHHSMAELVQRAEQRKHTATQAYAVRRNTGKYFSLKNQMETELGLKSNILLKQIFSPVFTLRTSTSMAYPSRTAHFSFKGLATP